MHSPKRNHGVDVSVEEVGAVKELLECGLYVQAYTRAQKSAPLADWRGTDARITAGRLAANLGAQRLGRWLHSRAWLADRTSSEAAYFHAFDILYRRGPFAAWRFLQRPRSFVNETETRRGNFCGLRARIASQFRDFEQANKWLKEAERLNATPSWLLCEQAGVFEAQDKIEAALERVREALRIRPWYRPAVQMAGQYLHWLNRNDEARELLVESLEHLESGAVAGQIAALHFEQEAYPAALQAYRQMSDWLPIQEEEQRKWLSARLADVSYHCGDYAGAAIEARKAEDAFYTRFAERLEDPNLKKQRVHLPVGFVRQHHLTCAPATLSALSAFWKIPIDHDELAARICYDGTPNHIERHWAEENGYVVREFRVA